MANDRSIGLGCMRLSTHSNRVPENGIAVIHAALAAGVRLLDTADVYCLDDSDIGHNERLIAEALRTWEGDRSGVVVATKGGMRRPDGAWVPDGRAAHLKAACEASRDALGVDAIDLYQLHVVDPRVKLETSVRALAALQRHGVIRRVGLCNVNVSQIEAARAIVEVESVQVPVSVLEDEHLRNGVVEYCVEHGIQLIAYRPLGGAKRVASLSRNEVLARIGGVHNVTAQEIALSWLSGLNHNIIPIPGPTRPAHATALARVREIRLSDAERAELDARFQGERLRKPRAQRRAPDDAAGDVVIVMGMPGAGKSTVAAEFVARGYARLNRDLQGGKLSDLTEQLGEGLRAGRREWVLDNTYASRADRNDVLECAWRHGVPVRLIWLDTDIGDAQVNAITRLIEAHGSLPMPEDLRARGKTDHRYFGPDAQFRYEREMEPPRADEGFKSIERRKFQRRSSRAGQRRAIFFDPADFRSISAQLRRKASEGWLPVGIGWRSEVPHVGGELEYELLNCVHPAGPPVCWCRKPLPGLVLGAVARFGIDLGASVMVGDAAADRTMAARLALPLVAAADFA